MKFGLRGSGSGGDFNTEAMSSLPFLTAIGGCKVSGSIMYMLLSAKRRPYFCKSIAIEIQKTREGCGCLRGLFGGPRGKLRESPGKIARKLFPNREMLQIPGFRAPGKANLPGTLGPHCRDLVPTFRAGCFLKSTVPAFSSFSEKWCIAKSGISSKGGVLSGSNATPLVSRYSCRATLVSQFSPYVFAVSHENRATSLKVSQRRPCRTLLGGGGVAP